ncbi:MAG: penicillin-binding protein 2 [Lentisphaeraceae bacterium]|nr:penicillin-binding protein 2 [Lentisphaeraceae bacterium]
MLRTAYQTRIVFLGIFLATGFILLVGRLRVVQIERHHELNKKAKAKYTSRVKSVGIRGNIYDGTRIPSPNLLASSKVAYNLLAEPGKMGSRREEVIQKLSRLLAETDKKTLERRFYSGSQEVVVQNNVDPILVSRIQQMKLPGLRYVESSVRFYPKDSLLCHVLGYTTHEGSGASGVERVYDKNLQPQEGYLLYERSRRAHKVTNLDEQKPLDGKDIHLTVLEPIQSIVEDELDRLMKEVKPKACYAIMANPKTGAIMALAQRPHFNPNDRNTMKPQNYNPRFLVDVYDPGSTMKAISLAGVLEHNKNIGLGTPVYCENGMWYYGGRPLRDAGHNYKNLRFWEVIQKSSNIGTAKLALTIKRRQYDVLRKFGFGERTGINLGVESKGILWPEKYWSKLSYTRLPIGQGISVTPLQMVQAYGALANKGRMMQLHLVDKIYDPILDKSKYTHPIVKNMEVISPEAAAEMVEALKTVTKKGGTATQAAVPGYEVAGKTGTAQKVIPAVKDANGKVIQKAYYSDTVHVSSFIGFVPADDPEFVLYVVCDEPPYKFRYGGKCAAPYFKRISEQTLSFLNVQPTIKDKVSRK